MTNTQKQNDRRQGEQTGHNPADQTNRQPDQRQDNQTGNIRNDPATGQQGREQAPDMQQTGNRQDRVDTPENRRPAD